MTQELPLVIVGGGFAGTTALVHELIKIADDPNITADSPMNITMLERYPKQLYGGVAYGKTAGFSEYHLNLTSKRATPFAANDIPGGFPTFPQYIQDLAAKAGAGQKEAILDHLQNPPREMFGEYLAHLVVLATERAGHKANITTRIAEATDLDVSGANPRLTIRENGMTQEIEAAHVVLATGFKETLRAPFVDKIIDSPLYLDDNYSTGAKGFYDQILAEQAKKPEVEQKAANTLVIGTGLSAMDAALRLLQSGYKGKITMISRNGLEHAGYGATTTEEYLKHSLVGEPRTEKVTELERSRPRFMQIVDAARKAGENYPGSVEVDLTRSMQREFALRMRQGYTPEEVLGRWERHITDIGNVLPDEVCNRMYGQYATWMTVHRVGTTPENTRIINEARNSGQLEITSGFISTRENEKLREVDGKIQATITSTPRIARAEARSAENSLREWDAQTATDGQAVTRTFDRVISGTGYALHYHDEKQEHVRRDIRDPLWNKLASKGLLDWHKKSGDGVELAPDLTLLDHKGQRVEGVTVTGVPAAGAIMFGRFNHPEKPGVAGGRMPPFFANIPGITGATMSMIPAMHQSLMQKRSREGHEISWQQSAASVGAQLQQQMAKGTDAQLQIIASTRVKAALERK